jgi:hypothetical protein
MLSGYERLVYNVLLWITLSFLLRKAMKCDCYHKPRPD